MKDLKLPKQSNKERECIWNGLKENDTLVGISHNHWGDNYIINYYKVIKKTPKGSVRLNNDTLLKNFPSNYHILTEELQVWINKIQLEKDIINILDNIDRDKSYFKENLEYEDALKLKEILENTMNKRP